MFVFSIIIDGRNYLVVDFTIRTILQLRTTKWKRQILQRGRFKHRRQTSLALFCEYELYYNKL